MEVYAITGGVSHNLNNGSLCYTVGLQNLGDAPLHRITERGPQQHGDSDLGLRLDPRVFALILLVQSSNNSGYWTARKQLGQIFAPHVSSMSIKFVLDNGDVRQIDCNPIESPRPVDAREIYKLQRMSARFRAPNPTLYDPDEVLEIFALGGGGGAFTVPTPVPTEIGASSLDQSKALEYTGTWYTHPIVKIQGPITDPVIENETTGEKLDFTGTTIGAGDYYEIDTRYEYKTVKDSNGADKMADLTTDSDLATFHLEHDDRGTGVKNNNIKVTGSSINEATEIYFRYKIRYAGI